MSNEQTAIITLWSLKLYMITILILIAVLLSTSVGDYLIKTASSQNGGLLSIRFIIGAFLYGLPAIGFFYLVKNHSMAAVGVFYSAATVILMALIGYIAFDESLGHKEILGISLAVASIIIMSQ
jgi:drug/metabolite transporter (DMT)-like permease